MKTLLVTAFLLAAHCISFARVPEVQSGKSGLPESVARETADAMDGA